MSNAEFGAYQDMLRQCEESMFGGDVQDDDEQWHDVKRQLPQAGQMAWVACPNNWLCQHQVFLAYFDSDGQWRDCTGLLLGRRVNFWQYADVPECNISC